MIIHLDNTKRVETVFTFESGTYDPGKARIGLRASGFMGEPDLEGGELALRLLFSSSFKNRWFLQLDSGGAVFDAKPPDGMLALLMSTGIRYNIINGKYLNLYPGINIGLSVGSSSLEEWDILGAFLQPATGIAVRISEGAWLEIEGAFDLSGIMIGRDKMSDTTAFRVSVGIFAGN